MWEWMGKKERKKKKREEMICYEKNATKGEICEKCQWAQRKKKEYETFQCITKWCKC